jgi:hypothetical protein
MNGMRSKFFLTVFEFSAAALTSIIVTPSKMMIGKMKDNKRHTWFFRKEITPNTFSNTYYMIRDNII